MGSEITLQQTGSANVDIEPPTASDRAVRKNPKNVPRKIHKAEREKLKREQLNDLFLNLADALDLTEPNNGKASILNEATRLLKDLFNQIECLKKENVSLLSESRYVASEKNELVEENYALEMQIDRLRNGMNATVEQPKPDLNGPAPEFSSGFAGHLMYAGSEESNSWSRVASNVRKPHARYPTPADSWPSRLLRERQREEDSIECLVSGHQNERKLAKN